MGAKFAKILSLVIKNSKFHMIQAFTFFQVVCLRRQYAITIIQALRCTYHRILCLSSKAIAFSNICYFIHTISLLFYFWANMDNLSFIFCMCVHLWFHFSLYNIFHTDPTDQWAANLRLQYNFVWDCVR